MSSVKATDMPGDVAVGRNLTAGGDLTVRGSARVDHDLVVGGWLEAANIVGTGKGLFASVDALRKAYPVPEEGWWAMVGDSVPAAVYRVENGKWTATGQTGGNPSVRVDDPAYLLERIEKNGQDIERNAGLIGENAESLQRMADSVGQPGGLAPLDEEGLIPVDCLPEALRLSPLTGQDIDEACM